MAEEPSRRTAALVLFFGAVDSVALRARRDASWLDSHGSLLGTSVPVGAPEVGGAALAGWKMGSMTGAHVDSERERMLLLGVADGRRQITNGERRNPPRRPRPTPRSSRCPVHRVAPAYRHFYFLVCLSSCS